MTRILIFGDSIAYGPCDKEGGWVSRLRKFFELKNHDALIYNLGVSGNDTEDLLERFESETKQRLKENEETIITFAIGINDTQFIHSKNGLKTEHEKFEKNIQKLINLAKKFSSKIIFVGLTPVDESKTTPIPWNTDKFYKNDSIQKYNEIIKSVCKKNKIYFIEILEKFAKLNYKKLLEDGLHPNSKGHKKIFETVKGFLIENRII